MAKFLLKNYKLTIVGILVLAFVLRMLLVVFVPTGLQVDEGLIVYTAQSLAETGKDPLNYSYPVYFKGFGWGQNPMIVYLLVPLVKIFGLNNLLVFRLAIALLSVLIVFFAYLLARELFGEKIALLAVALLAISPWSLTLSRIIYSVNILPLFYLAGLYFLFKGLKTLKNYFFIVAAIFLGLSLYTYDLSFLWLPILAIILFFVFKEDVRKMSMKNYLSFFITFGLIALPIAIFYLKNQFGLLVQIEHWGPFSFPTLNYTRFAVVSIFNLPTAVVFLKFIKNYLVHLAPTFLFLDATLTIFPKNFGLLYLIELPFLLFGLIICLKNYQEAKYKFLFWWLILSPLPASLTIENTPHPLRFINAMFLLEIIIAIGFLEAWNMIKYNEKRKTIFQYLVVIFFLINFLFFIFNFLIKYPKTSFLAFQGNDREMTEFILANYENYEQFVVITKEPYLLNLMPYNYALYSNYPSQKIQASQFIPNESNIIMGKVIFDYKKDLVFQPGDNILYLVSFLDQDFIKDKVVQKEFKDLYGNTVYYAVIDKL